MKIRFYNARILPLDDATPLFSGELVVDGSINIEPSYYDKQKEDHY